MITYTQLRYAVLYLVVLMGIILSGKPLTAIFLALSTLVLLALIAWAKRSFTASWRYRYWVLSSPPQTRLSIDPSFHFSRIGKLWLPGIGEKMKGMRYQSFLRSYYWKSIRAYVLHKRGKRCSKCGMTFEARDLHLHHKTYCHHGYEHLFLSDLQVLCQEHHREVETEKRISSQVKI